jgi:hypothetical protein
MRWFWKHWPWLPPTRNDAMAIVVIIALLAAVLIAMMKFPNSRYGANNGFGPDWDCSSTPYGGCVKRVPPAPVSKEAPSK